MYMEQFQTRHEQQQQHKAERPDIFCSGALCVQRCKQVVACIDDYNGWKWWAKWPWASPCMQARGSKRATHAL